MDGLLTKDGLFKHHKKRGAQMDKCFQLYTLNWAFGTRNQSIVSYSINTYYKSA